MVPVRIISGQETFSTNAHEFYVFACIPGYSDRGLWDLAKDREVEEVAMTSMQKHAAVAGRAVDRGAWFDTNYAIREGTVLKVTCKQSAAHLGDRIRAQQTLLRVRANGPLQRLRMDLLDRPGRLVASGMVYGRFDVITLEDALKRGVNIHPKFHHLFQKVFGDVMELTQVEGETAAQEKVEEREVADAEGDTIIISKRRRARNLR